MAGASVLPRQAALGVQVWLSLFWKSEDRDLRGDCFQPGAWLLSFGHHFPEFWKSGRWAVLPAHAGPFEGVTVSWGTLLFVPTVFLWRQQALSPGARFPAGWDAGRDGQEPRTLRTLVPSLGLCISRLLGPLLPFFWRGWHCRLSQGSCGSQILVFFFRERERAVCNVCCSENRNSISHYVVSI
jgi:hypothetical protein